MYSVFTFVPISFMYLITGEVKSHFDTSRRIKLSVRFPVTGRGGS
jgi:hypothetical protein